ncbi:MAG: ATP synthase F1 subunit epsilon [Dysgonamonadaceae bacterium]|jgi:F-type H+-transporting ATPase subunit epsilon|nr:ATP synthase F1 subunit epsilon [Dysgonamonadaceae bacterium]
MSELRLVIVSPDKRIFRGEITSVTLPGAMGNFSILPNHAPIVSSLQEGNLEYVTFDGGQHTLEIQGGFAEMSNGEVSVCVTT